MLRDVSNTIILTILCNECAIVKSSLMLFLIYLINFIFLSIFFKMYIFLSWCARFQHNCQVCGVIRSVFYTYIFTTEQSKLVLLRFWSCSPTQHDTQISTYIYKNIFYKNQIIEHTLFIYPSIRHCAHVFRSFTASNFRFKKRVISSLFRLWDK